MKTLPENIEYPITISIPYSTILIGMQNFSLPNNDMLTKDISIQIEEYDLAYNSINLIALSSNSPCMKDITDDTIILTHCADEHENLKLDNLIKSFITYKNAKTNHGCKTSLSALIPFMSTAHILSSLVDFTAPIRESENIKDIINRNTVISLKTELSIRGLYTFEVCEIFQYTSLIDKYNEKRKNLFNSLDTYHKYRLLCKIKTICIE